MISNTSHNLEKRLYLGDKLPRVSLRQDFKQAFPRVSLEIEFKNIVD